MNIHSSATTRNSSKREQILDAALGLFATRGFDGTSVPDISSAAKVGAGTIYRYFASKEVLGNVVYQQWKGALMQHLLTDFDFEAPPRDQFHDLWVRLAAFARTHPRAFAFLELHHHARYLDAESRALEEGSLRPILAFVDATRRAGVLRDMAGEAIMALVWGAFVGLVKAENLGHLTLTDELLQQTENSVWAAICGPA